MSAGALVRTARPRQWTKNLLVFAAPLAAGQVRGTWLDATLAFVAFTLVAATVYTFNDVADREADRAHPTKRRRPVAAGEVSPRAAVGFGLVCAAAGLGLAWWVEPRLAVLLLGYLLLQLAYALRLKHEPVLDIVVVASGFLIRAIAGALATGIEVSQWFLLVAGFGALFIVGGKRYSELRVLGSGAGTRRVLEGYSESYLGFVWGMAGTATVLSYALWAFDVAPHPGVSWHVGSIAPFLVGVMRYAVDIDRGAAGEPEDIILGDRVLQVVGAIWLGITVVATFSV